MRQPNWQTKSIVALALLWAIQTRADSVDDAKKAAEAAAAPAASGGKVIADDPTGADPKVLSQLGDFCIKWMGFLAVRESDNKKAIKFEKGSAGVVGKYVGYGTDYECRLKAAHGGGKGKEKPVPVATITYREYLYQQEGPSEAEAKETQPRQMEVTEVMEIFRYAGGKWVY